MATAEVEDAAGVALGRADRLLRLAELIAAEPGRSVTAEALSETLGVSVRTVYRDIETLRANGYAIEGAPGVGFQQRDATGAGRPVLTPGPRPASDPVRRAVQTRHRADEAAVATALAEELAHSAAAAASVSHDAEALVAAVRRDRHSGGGVDAFMSEYALSTDEGVALMCLAEALLRIPDAETADRLIEDKIGGAAWEAHLGRADSLFVNASTLGLMISGRVMRLGGGEAGREGAWGGLTGVLGRLIQRSGEPLIRTAVRQAMRIMGRQFVMGRTIEEALGRLDAERRDRVGEAPLRASFDMLGEAAYTDADAKRYLAAYLNAVRTVGARGTGGDAGPILADGVSVKLSALHPRYEDARRDVADVLYARLLEVAEASAAADIGLCVDAEESDRLDYSFDIFERLALEPSLKGWDGLGLALQAYQKRARPAVDWLADVARRSGRRLMVRLVKGAYWDQEIKRAQEGGYVDFPVFTRKAHTDVSYLACAKAMFDAGAAFYPCFATHNAQTLAALRALSRGRAPEGTSGAPETGWELQRLHGMGGPLYGALGEIGFDAPCRVYAPVGGHEDLLAYLVRRLLENGANSSFVNRLSDDAAPLSEIAADPVATARGWGFAPHPMVASPSQVFAPRINSRGLDLSDPFEVAALRSAVIDLERTASPTDLEPMIAGRRQGPRGPGESWREVRNPADRQQHLGRSRDTRPDEASAALAAAIAAQPAWDQIGAAARAAILERAADLFEAERTTLLRFLVREAGKTWKDAVADLREAIDFLRYYAAEARRLFGGAAALPGPTGEENTLRLTGRGVWLCISPWNFPLAIFTGQVAAALAAGNAALAKPAEQTPLIAAKAVALLRRAGVPEAVLQLLPGDGAAVAAPLLADARLAGVAFTGSTETARSISRALADREGPIIPFIAETGGLNAMIVDSSALPEQVTRDVIASAFQSAGQRCSALRMLYLPEETADKQLEMLRGAMAELKVGDPAALATDVGPLIDDAAAHAVRTHCAALRRKKRLVAEAPAPISVTEQQGAWVVPQAYRVSGVAELAREVFGPVLHVATYPASGLDGVVDAINACGYGLTLGVHSRIESRWRRIARRARVGNVYVNRNQIGAVVGSQPFGGEGLSGTGPKAGGPHYLARFGVERTLSVDLTAQGGDASLMSMEA